MNNSTTNQQNTPVNKAKRAAYSKQWILNNKNKVKEYRKQHYFDNKDKIKEYSKQHYFNNKDKLRAYHKHYRLANKDRLTVSSKQYYLDNKAKIAVSWKQYQLNNKADLNAYMKQYTLNNKSKIAVQQKQYKSNNKAKIVAQYKQRYQTDLLFRIKRKLRSVVGSAFKRIGKNKPARTEQLLGCSWIEAKAHFERLFQEGMTWENHGEWHIDHIRPVASFKVDELHLMNHISNLQPLWAEENLGSKKVSDNTKWSLL